MPRQLLPKKYCKRCAKKLDNRNTSGMCVTCFTEEQKLILTIKHYCPCGAEVYHPNSLCKPCANKELSIKYSGANNPNYKHGTYTKKETT